jgi:hypothetical protein
VKALMAMWRRVLGMFRRGGHPENYELAALYIDGDLLADVRRCSFSVDGDMLTVRGAMDWFGASDECSNVVGLAIARQHVRMKVLMCSRGDAWFADGAIVKAEASSGVGVDTTLEFEFRGKLTA